MGYSTSFGLTSFCIHLFKRYGLCHLSVIMKGTKGVDICILFLFLSNYLNDKTPREITCPIRDPLVQLRFPSDPGHVALCSPSDILPVMCIFTVNLCL